MGIAGNAWVRSLLARPGVPRKRAAVHEHGAALDSGSVLASQLRWEPFPNERQRSKLERKSGGRKLGETRYDLRIWEVREEERGELVYERRGLLEPEHDLEQPLTPAQRFFWSARACFALGEGTACTPWASSLVPARGGRSCESSEIPDSNYFRFVTTR